MNSVVYVFLFVCLSRSQILGRHVNRNKMEGFVIGGNQTSITNYPHSAFLHAYCRDNWLCGGAILNQRMIITAGHCLYRCNMKMGHYIDVYLGSTNILKVKIMRLVERIAVHEEYNEDMLENDIGLATLDKTIPLGRNTKRIVIPRRYQETILGSVAGWGMIDDYSGRTSVSLKEVSQKIRSKNTCALVGSLHAGMFCAGSSNYFEDRPAPGDSGSALITNSYNVIGITSFYIPLYPALSVYTNVSYYYTWIEENSGQLYCGRSDKDKNKDTRTMN